MEITLGQYERIESCLPRQRGNVRYSNLQVLNAILYVCEHGGQWRGLPKRFGNWHTIYTRMNRWYKSGVLERVFEALQDAQIVRIRFEPIVLDGFMGGSRPDGVKAKMTSAHHRARTPAADGQPKFVWVPRMLVRR